MKSYTLFGPEKWEEYFLTYMRQYLLEEKGYNVSIKKKMDFHLDITPQVKNWYGVIRKHIIFQNDETGQFFTINHSDHVDDVSEEIISHPLCIAVLKCQYKKGFYGKWKNKVSAFTYGVKEKHSYFKVREEIKEQGSHINPIMYFKGNETGRRDLLIKLAERNLINKDFGFRDERGRRALQVPQKDYLQRMAECKIVLSLPGQGNCCHREIEAFGIGVPVMMMPLQNEYYNNLIPDFHYIAIDVGENGTQTGATKIKYFTEEDHNRFCATVEQTLKRTVNDSDLLARVSSNAMKWFEENIAYPSNMKLVEKILKGDFNYEL